MVDECFRMPKYAINRTMFKHNNINVSLHDYYINVSDSNSSTRIYYKLLNCEKCLYNKYLIQLNIDNMLLKGFEMYFSHKH